MRKHALTFCAVWLLVVSPAHAGGMAVADAVSHMYESLNLEKTVQQLEAGLEQLELVKQYTDTIQETYDKAHANYNRAKGVFDDLMAVKSFYDKTKASWMGRYEQYKAFYESVSDPDKAIDSFKGLLDDAFVDPRSIDSDQWKKLMDRQFDLRQLALKELLDKTEQTTSGMEDRVSKAQELANSVDQTTSEKDAADLSNRLLLEILLVLQDMLAVDAQYQQSMAALKYQGVTEESIKVRQNKLLELEEKSKRPRWETEELAKYGLDKNSTIKEIRDNKNKPTIDDIINWDQ